jgi:hypothetical protein
MELFFWIEPQNLLVVFFRISAFSLFFFVSTSKMQAKKREEKEEARKKETKHTSSSFGSNSGGTGRMKCGSKLCRSSPSKYSAFSVISL